MPPFATHNQIIESHKYCDTGDESTLHVPLSSLCVLHSVTQIVFEFRRIGSQILQGCSLKKKTWGTITMFVTSGYSTTLTMCHMYPQPGGHVGQRCRMQSAQ